jgi:hypothetical protein
MGNGTSNSEAKSDRDAVNKTGEDPIVEPENSTVDDWIGQRVGRDETRADEALASSGGDVAEAERRFERETERRDGEPKAESSEPAVRSGRVADRGFGESDIPDPMPAELRRDPDQTEYVDEMGGESPTG